MNGRPVAYWVATVSAIGLAVMPAHAGSPCSFSPCSYALDAQSSVKARVSFMGLSSKTAGFPLLLGRMMIQPGKPQGIDLDVQIDARALTASDANIASRLKSPAFFDVTRFPTIRFHGQSMAMTGDRSATVSGQLTARGVTRPSVLRVTFATPPAHMNGHDPLALTGSTVIDRRDFGMTAWPMVVGREVTITLDARMVPG
ncbi:MAG: YceI family protein [Novosphingobium sp.]